MDGVIYSPNVALDLTDIGVDGDSLRCLTPLTSCCRNADIPNSDGTLGDWIFLLDHLLPLDLVCVIYRLKELVQLFFIIIAI